MKQSALLAEMGKWPRYWLLIASIIFIFYTIFRSKLVKPVVSEDGVLPRLLQEFCQFIEEPITGVEGEVPSEVGTLRGVVVVFRHGDRYPLHGKLDNYGAATAIADCSPSRDVDRRSFANYEKLINSPHFKQFVTITRPLNEFNRTPSRSHCAPGELTAEGALQLLKLGNFMHQQYRHNGWLIQPGRKWDLQFSTTPYSRTVQSALAFVASFIYPLHKLFGRIRLNLSNMTHFCMEKHCRCANVLKLHRAYEKERTHFFESYFGVRVSSLLHSLSSVYGADITDAMHFLDVSLGRYICRRMPLPCHNGVCITYGDVVQVAEMVSERDAAMFNASLSSSGSVLRRLVVAESTAIFQSIFDVIQALRSNVHLNVLHIYSGHDVTLRPLLFALGVLHREPAHYASRIVFEVYEKDSTLISPPDENLFVRVLHNGVDRTSDVIFCRGSTSTTYNFCPFRLFQRFVEEDLFEIAHKKSLDEICDQQV